MQCSCIQMHLTTKVLALVKEYLGMEKKSPKTVLSLGETATLFLLSFQAT